MSYLTADSSVDDLLLMVAAYDGVKPVAYDIENPDYDIKVLGTHNTTKGRPAPTKRRADGTYISEPCVFLNLTDNAHKAYQAGLIWESHYSYRVMHLSWKGHERVEQLLARGRTIPTEEELDAYGKRARLIVEGGEHGDYIPLDVPNPRGIVPTPLPKKKSLMERIFG